MTGFLAITVAQPYASLIAAGVKTFETRVGPPAGDMRPPGVMQQSGYRINRGDRIAIHAAASTETIRSWPGPYQAAHDRSTGDYMLLGFYPGEGGGPLYLPLSAIVATAVVADAVPILGQDGQRPEGAHSAIWEYEHEGDLPHQQGGLWLIGLADGAPRRIEDQRPYGDWTPGRWAWLLTDVEPCDPVPATGRQGVWRWTPGGDGG